MTEIFRHRNAHRIVGLSILVLLILVAATILMLLHRNEAFSTKNEYYLQANQTQLRGLHKSMAVRILGEPVGTVTDISYLGPSSEVRLTMQVKAPNDDTKNVIWENSRLIVARTFGIGEPYLEIERGNDILGAIVSNLLDREADAVRVKNVGTDGIHGRGVRIRKLVSGSPAEIAGLKVDDIITSFNNVPVDSLGGMYELMSMVSAGSDVVVGVHGRVNPVKVSTGLVLASRLESGGTIIQFQAEENRLEGLASKISQVQESISSVETSLVETLTLTNNNMERALVPAIKQFVATNQSVEKTSDQLREDTLIRANQTLAMIDQSSRELNARIGQIADDVTAVLDSRVGPSFDRLGKASDQLGSAAESFKETTQSIQGTTESVGSEANVAIRDLQVAVEKLNQLLEQSQNVVSVLEREAQDLPGTVNRMNQTVNSAQRVMDGASEHVLLRRAVKRSDQKKSGQQSTGPIRSLFGR